MQNVNPTQKHNHKIEVKINLFSNFSFFALASWIMSSLSSYSCSPCLFFAIKCSQTKFTNKANKSKMYFTTLKKNTTTKTSGKLSTSLYIFSYFLWLLESSTHKFLHHLQVAIFCSIIESSSFLVFRTHLAHPQGS